jgi:antitoxin StbD
MTRLATRNICTMTELREPQKVFDRANGEPVAILKNSQLVGYLVPADYAERLGLASMDELAAHLRKLERT